MRIVFVAVILFSTFIPVTGFAQTADTVDISIMHEATRAIERGIQYLRTNRQDNGSWSHYPAITALVVAAMLESPGDIVTDGDPDVARGLEFILANVQPDGGIYTQDPMRSYNTSIALRTLVIADNPAYATVITNARNYLLSLQADERSGYATSDSLYGGIGYGNDERPDLSNLQIALEALAMSEQYEQVAESDMLKADGALPTVNSRPYYEKAIIFLTNTQNLQATNPHSWAGDDGGFMYFPGESKAGGLRSYGSMTYAGLKSFIYAKLDKSDERVQAAYQWILQNYDVKENPGNGTDGLYYYYHTMSKALNIYGVNFIQSPDGTSNNWREDLIVHLVSAQKEDGSWVNDNPRWWEENRDLVTAYTILALVNAGWPEQ